MRRNYMPRDHGQELQQGPNGPLITNHLKNLNKELNMLRRKREVIRQEQALLSMDMGYETDQRRKRQSQPFPYNMPMYGNIGQYSTGDEWQADAPPPFKQFTPPSRVLPWQSQYPEQSIPSLLSESIRMPQSFQPSPGMRSGFGNGNQFKRSNFKPNNQNLGSITKNKSAAPNKLNSYPVKERRDLVSKAILKDLSSSQSDKPLVLREDETPTQQMTGRLELALGCIVKEIKSANVDNLIFNTCLTNAAYQRVLKQVVRERIRSVMLNQIVGPVTDMVQRYRAKFPNETDNTIVDVIMATEQPKNSATIVETEDPEEFFKANFPIILERKVDEMFNGIYRIYNSASRKQNLCYTIEKNESKATEDDDKDKVLPHSKHAMEILEKVIGKPVSTEEKNVLSKYYKEIIQNLLEEQLPSILPKFTKHIMKFIEIDNQYKSLKTSTLKKIREQPKTRALKVLHGQDDEQNDKVDEDNKQNDEKEAENNKQEEENDSQEENKDDVKKVTLGKETPNDEGKDEEMISNGKQSEEVGAQNKTNFPTTPAVQRASTPSILTTPSTPLGRELPYFIKLIGRPHLPTRAAICEFLNKFNPASIKKHKSINNLLVVGFTSQEDYDKILTADGTVLGNITMLIKSSEKVVSAKENDPKKDSDGSQDTNDVKPALPEAAAQEVPANPNLGNLKCGSIKTEEPALNVKSEANNIKMETATEQSTTPLEETQIKKEVPAIEPIAEEDENSEDNSNSQDGSEANKNTETGDTNKGPLNTVKEGDGGKATPTRAANRMANVTPSSIRTRRASRLMQN